MRRLVMTRSNNTFVGGITNMNKGRFVSECVTIERYDHDSINAIKYIVIQSTNSILV